jgi:hypothetical protein
MASVVKISSNTILDEVEAMANGEERKIGASEKFQKGIQSP